MKVKSHYLTILTAIGILAITACAKISARDFEQSARYDQYDYCQSEKLKFEMFGQHYDSRCDRFDITEKKEVFNDLCDGKKIKCFITEEV